MPIDKSYDAVMSRKNEILKKSVGIDYDQFEISPLAFDYEGLMNSCGYTLPEIQKIQRETGVGNTPLVELRNITELVRVRLPAPARERESSSRTNKLNQAAASRTAGPLSPSIMRASWATKAWCVPVLEIMARPSPPRQPNAASRPSLCRKCSIVGRSVNRRSWKRRGPARRMARKSGS